ncbi:MAG TPA: DUF3667 domain-containing protein [Longimicrobiaceae bacterium]|jgi:hypothetical protein|nr:DUF3667 domain-containing protein [Longimicrobiaceae bacterium]
MSDISLTASAALEATAEPAVQAAAVPGACLNCATPLSGGFCSGCGQSARQERLTVAHVASDLVSQVLSLDGALLRTAVEMTTRPGGLIADYVTGKRRRYVSPLAYLFFGTAAWLLLSNLYEAQMVAWMRDTMAQSESGFSLIFSPRQAEFYRTTLFTLSRQFTYTSILMGVPFALTIRLLFRNSGINLAESFVFTLYAFGHAALLYAVASTVLIVGLHASVDVAMKASYAIYLAVCIHAAIGLFGSPVKSALKSAAALVAGYLGFSVVFALALLGYVALFVAP